VPYTTQQDLVDRYGEEELIDLTDRAKPPIGAIDTAVLDAKIADADNLIDSYLARRYVLPVSETPLVLTRIAAAIVRYYLYTDAPTEQIRDDYNDAMKFLGQVASGKVDLPLPTGADPEGDSTGAVLDGPGRIFDADSLQGF